LPIHIWKFYFPPSLTSHRLLVLLVGTGSGELKICCCLCTTVVLNEDQNNNKQSTLTCNLEPRTATAVDSLCWEVCFSATLADFVSSLRSKLELHSHSIFNHHLWYLKNSLLFLTNPSDQKKSLRVGSKSIWVKDRSAFYLLQVKSMLRSGRVRAHLYYRHREYSSSINGSFEPDLN